MTKAKKGRKVVARVQQRQKVLKAKAEKAGVLEVAVTGGETTGGNTVLVKRPVTNRFGNTAGKTVYAGHRVRGVMADGTPILEAVAKPSSFTKKQIGDTIRDVMTERMAETPLRYAG